MGRSYVPQFVKKRLPGVICTVLTGAFLYLALTPADTGDVLSLADLESVLMDAKFRIRQPQKPTGDVVLVAMDDRTVERFGTIDQLSLQTWARLVDRLSAAGPQVVGFNFVFKNPDPVEATSEQEFADAIRRAGNVVLGVSLKSGLQLQNPEQPALPRELEQILIDKQVFPTERRPAGTMRQIRSLDQGRDLELPLPSLIVAAAAVGYIDVDPNTASGLHYQPQLLEYRGQLFPSLSLQLTKFHFKSSAITVEIHDGAISRIAVDRVEVPTDSSGRYIVNFDGPRGTHETISMVDILEGSVPPGRLRNKVIIVGPTHKGSEAIVGSPFDSTLPTTEFHANIIDNIIQQRYLNRDGLARLIDVAVILLFGILLGRYLPRFDAQRGIVYAGFVLVVFAVLNVLVFLSLNSALSFVYPVASLLVTSISLVAYKYLTDEREKKRMRETFREYLDQRVIEQLMHQPEALRLDGERREMTVLFSDIHGFTSISEKMDATEIVQFLNQYFEKMTGLVFQYKGTLDKLIGDSIMSFWGHPVQTRDHGLRATLCALEMTRAVEDLLPVLILPGGAKLEIGIGVNTGPMVVGNMGSGQRFGYTVLGDNVNLGSRLDSLNKYYGTQILISDATYEACRHLVVCRQIDTIQVKGKQSPIVIYEPLGIRRLSYERRQNDRRQELTRFKRLKRALVFALFGERRQHDRRLGSERLVLSPEQEEVAAMYEHALSLYKKADFDAAEMAFDHVLSLSPNDGPSKLMKSRISKHRTEYANAGSHFDPIFKFDDK